MFKLEDNWMDAEWMLDHLKYWNAIHGNMSMQCYKAILAYWFKRWNFEDGNPDSKLIYDTVKTLGRQYDVGFIYCPYVPTFSIVR